MKKRTFPPFWKTVAPTPWSVKESVGGKMLIYDANNKVVIIPNYRSTNKKPEELLSVLERIVYAVNSMDREELNKLMASFMK